MIRQPLDETIDALRRALMQAATIYGWHLADEYRRGVEVERAAQYAPDIMRYLRPGIEQGWVIGWDEGGAEVRRRLSYPPAPLPRREGGTATAAAGTAAPRGRAGMPVLRGLEALADDTRFRFASPIALPSDYRTWAETHDPVTGALVQSRLTAEWLAEHEATVSAATPRQYVDRYVAQRLPPLRGVVDQGLLEAARDAVAATKERGFGTRETMQALKRDFPLFARTRLENIARTEGATLYQTGHVSRYRADGLVKGWRFHAILDDRTTETCSWHNGKCYRDDDASAPVPPLHFQCRSTVSPILWHEDVEWAGAAPEDSAPQEGFGRVEEGLLPPSMGAEEVFVGAGVRS